jgi:hypothetical protein
MLHIHLSLSIHIQEREKEINTSMYRGHGMELSHINHDAAHLPLTTAPTVPPAPTPLFNAELTLLNPTHPTQSHVSTGVSTASSGEALATLAQAESILRVRSAEQTVRTCYIAPLTTLFPHQHPTLASKTLFCTSCLPACLQQQLWIKHNLLSVRQ